MLLTNEDVVAKDNEEETELNKLISIACKSLAGTAAGVWKMFSIFVNKATSYLSQSPEHGIGIIPNLLVDKSYYFSH